MKISRTDQDISIMVNSSQRTSRIIERQRRHAPIIQSLTSIIAFPGKESHKYPLSPTNINFVSIWSEMECGLSSPYHTPAIKIISGVFFYISLYLPLTT